MTTILTKDHDTHLSLGSQHTVSGKFNKIERFYLVNAGPDYKTFSFSHGVAK